MLFFKFFLKGGAKVMSKKDTKNTPAKEDNSMVEVRVINNYFDRANNKKFRSVDDVYKTDKERAEELVRLGYVVYTDDPNVDDDNVDPNVNDNGDEDTNVDDANVNDEGTPEATEDDSNADDNVDPNADDSNVPNE
jgi:hypothetical protein